MTHNSSLAGNRAASVDWLGDIAIGTWTWQPAVSLVQWDDACERIYGLEPGTFDGTFDSYLRYIHPEDRDHVLKVIEQTAGEGGDYSIRHRVVWPDGSVKWVEGQGRITIDSSGTPIDGRGIVYQLSDRMTLDRERDELTASAGLARLDLAASRERLRFLIDVSDAVSGSLKTERVAQHFAALIAERVASSCVVELELQDPFGHLLSCVARRGGDIVLTAGSSVELPAAAQRLSTAFSATSLLTEEVLELDTDEQRRLLEFGGSRYATAVPLEAHGARIGTVVAVREDRAWSRDGREVLEAACRRAAGAFDRAVLHADRSKFVAMFQAAATPQDLPDIPGIDLAVHYRPATDLVRLGGDLYDVYELPDGAWIVAVGDVVGKGIVAAGHAELARTAMRAAVLATEGPAAALDVLNRTLLAEASRPMLTVALAKLRVEGAGVAVDFAVAGHPPPLVVDESGSWDVVKTSGTMLGVTASADFSELARRLAPGEGLALYTDGITESRFGSNFFGVERLGLTLAKGWPSSAQSLVGDVGATIDTWSAGQPSDDVLLMVARYVGSD